MRHDHRPRRLYGQLLLDLLSLQLLEDHHHYDGGYEEHGPEDRGEDVDEESVLSVIERLFFGKSWK